MRKYCGVGRCRCEIDEFRCLTTHAVVWHQNDLQKCTINLLDAKCGVFVIHPVCIVGVLNIHKA